MIGSAKAQTTEAAGLSAAKATASTSFGPLRQVHAGAVNVGYVEAGPADGRPVLLLHGFPYDIHSFVEVTPLLAARGYRVIVPYMRGHGTTTFLSSSTPRDAQQTVMALDVLALMDALKIEKALLVGYDLGSRSADIIAALWPQRCKALVSTTGYLITNPVANLEPAAPALEWAFWHQYYFSGDPRYAAIEKKLDTAPTIAVPTVTVDGKYAHHTLPVGHNVPQEDPKGFTQAVVQADHP
jgi:pimeloyl-ACP methyl ester carboxylesterase